MSWWDRPLDAVRKHFSFNAGSFNAGSFKVGPVGQPSGTRAEPTVTSPEGWRDVPRLQRTLAEPIAPVAINDGFRDSLAAFTDPSFLAPLSHQIDPLDGGLVAGLVSPGESQSRGGPELVVPQRATVRPTPGVQRLATWSPASTGPELLTVPLEYPHQSASAASRLEPATQRDSLTTGLTPPSATSVPPVAGSAGPNATSDAPVTGSAGPTSGRSAPAPADLPRLVQRSTGSDLGTVALPPLPTPNDRSAAGEPAGDSPVARQTPGASAAGPEPAPALTLGSANEVEPSVTELELVTPEPAADRAVALELPGQPATDPSPSSRPSVPARPSLQRSADGSTTDAPTLGARPASSLLGTPSEPLGQPVGTPDDPPVQRITYLPSHPAARTSAPSSSSPSDLAKGVNGPTHAGTQAQLPTVQPLRELPSVPLAESAATTSRRSLGTVAASAHRGVVGPSGHTEPEPVSALTAPSTESGGNRTWPEVVVSRFEEHDHSSTDFDQPGFTEVPLVVAGSLARPSAGSSHESTIDHPTIHDEDVPSSATVDPPEWTGGTDSATPVTPPESLGPAVPVEPWTSAASDLTPPAGPAVGFAAQRSAPITAVQRQVVGVNSATPWADPTLPRQRGAEAAPANSVHGPPLMVSRRAAANQSPRIGPRAGEGMSFERMFSGAVPVPTVAASDTGNVHSTVQREPVDSGSTSADPSVSAATESGPPAAAALPGGPGPAGGEAGANLDEMARRLYEPLAARLREELWLDRERAGLMSDA